jgi:hypothetical protein
MSFGSAENPLEFPAIHLSAADATNP